MKYNVRKNLEIIAKKFVRVLGNRAREFAPEHLRPAIHSSYSEGEMTVYTDEPDGRTYGDIFAREYGAGLFGSRREKYKIFPSKKKVLMFEWEKADMGAVRAHLNKRLYGSNYKAQSQNYPRLNEKIYGIPGSSKNFSMIVPGGKRIMFNYVEHPGFPAVNAGEGFMQPAVNQTLVEVEESFDRGEISSKLWGAVQKHIQDMFSYKLGKGVSFKIYKSAIPEGYSSLSSKMSAKKRGYGGSAHGG